MPTWRKRIVFAILIATTIFVTAFGIYFAISNGTESEQTTMGTETIATTTTEPIPSTTTEPVVTTTTSTTSTTTSTTTTSTTTTTIPEPAEPPASGLYIVDEDVYSHGEVVFHEGKPAGVGFIVPKGTRIYAAFDGELIVLTDAEGNHLGLLENSDSTKATFVYGNGLEFVEGFLNAGDLLAVIVDDGPRLHFPQLGSFNLFVVLSTRPGSGTYDPDEKLLMDYFSYVE